jgi:hypothetical protein
MFKLGKGESLKHWFTEACYLSGMAIRLIPGRALSFHCPKSVRYQLSANCYRKKKIKGQTGSEAFWPFGTMEKWTMVVILDHHKDRYLLNDQHRPC